MCSLCVGQDMRQAIVTGASRGIGKAVADALESDGFQVHRVSTAVLDVADKEAVDRYVSPFDRVDVLVNCAGIGHYNFIEDLDEKDMRRVYEVNVMGTVHFCKACIPKMKEEGGLIVNIGSLRGIHCSPGRSSYTMSKFAVRAFTKTLAMELREHGIKATCINPGYVYTDMLTWRIEREGLAPEDILQPQDIADAVMMLTRLSKGAVVEEINLGEIWD